MDDLATDPPVPPGARVAAFFDLDKTIIARSSMLAFSRPFFAEGIINRRAVLKSGYAQLMFLLGGAEADQIDRMREYLTRLCAGWDAAQVRAVVEETLHDIVDPLVYSEAAELIAEHQACGHDVVVISASGQELVAPIARMLGAQHSVGTSMVIAEGKYTGELEFYCYGEQKAEAIVELAATHGYRLEHCYAYTDSVTDLPMLEAVGRPCVVNPNRALRRIATERGWEVRTFSGAVSPARRLTSSATSTVAATAVGLGAVAAGVTWYGMQRRRKD
ncbi:MAG: HAD-IB family hydrolase [Sciscionella sp.]